MVRKSVHTLWLAIPQTNPVKRDLVNKTLKVYRRKDLPGERWLFKKREALCKRCLFISLASDLFIFWFYLYSAYYVTATVIRKSTEWACKLYLFLSLKVIHRILRKAKLVRFPKSPKQLILPQKRKMVAFSWEKSEEIALVQFIALFGELKKGKWLSFGAQHEYWDKAAEFIQEMVKTAHRRSSKTYQKLLFSYIHYNLHISIEAVYFVNDLIRPENWCLENFLELVKMYIVLQILQSFLMS